MSKTAGISLRVEPEIKDVAEELYGSFGLTLSDAITLFLFKSIQVGGLPFELTQPRFNDETEAAICEAKDILSGKIDSPSYNSADELISAALETDD